MAAVNARMQVPYLWCSMVNDFLLVHRSRLLLHTCNVTCDGTRVYVFTSDFQACAVELVQPRQLKLFDVPR